MSFIALKALRFSGKDYLPGETIPEGVVLPGRKRALMDSGCLKVKEEAQDEKATPRKKAKKQEKKEDDV